MENGEKFMPRQFELKLATEVKQELGPQNLKNLTKFAGALKEVLEEQKIDGHLLLIGGTVMPEKQGTFHKDVDLIFYSEELNLKNAYIKEGDEDFAKFAEFFKKMGDKLRWTEEINEPYFYHFAYCFDGSIVLKPKDGVTLEILPTREDSLKNSVNEYVEQLDRPAVVLF